MKERLSVREAFFVLISRLLPFGTVVIYPWSGSKMEFEDLRYDTPQSKLSLTDRGELIIPIGGSARVTFKSRGVNN